MCILVRNETTPLLLDCLFGLHHYHLVSPRSTSPHIVVEGSVQFSYVMVTSVSIRRRVILRDHCRCTGARACARNVDGLTENVRTVRTMSGVRRVPCVSGASVRRTVAECG